MIESMWLALLEIWNVGKELAIERCVFVNNSSSHIYWGLDFEKVIVKASHVVFLKSQLLKKFYAWLKYSGQWLPNNWSTNLKYISWEHELH